MKADKIVSVGVGVVVFRGGDVLLVKRGKAPFEGKWSIPGGRLEYGESLEAAAIREVSEETGVEISLIGLIGVFETDPAAGAGHLVLIDYAAEWKAGEPVAGDDAAEAAFFPLEAALSKVSWDKTREAVQRAASLRDGAVFSL